MSLKEFGGAPVQANSLALGQLALAVRLVEALGRADFDHPSDMINLRHSSEKLNLGKRKTYRECISATTLSSFSTAAIFSAEVGWGLPKPNILMDYSVLEIDFYFIEGSVEKWR